LKEGARDAIVVCAFYPESLDAGEVLEEPAPRDDILPDIDGHSVKRDTEYFHSGKLC